MSQSHHFSTAGGPPQATTNVQQGTSSSRGSARNSHNPSGTEVTAVWQGFTFPVEYIPILHAVNPHLVNEHDRVLASLLSAAPSRVTLPPILVLPTSRENYLLIFRNICLQMSAFPPTSRRQIIIGGNGFSFDHLFLTLIVFRYPENIMLAASNLAEMLLKMLDEFLKWTTSWDAKPNPTLYDADAIAKDLTQQAMRKLTARGSVDSESKWLYSLLRAIGDIPHVWGIGDFPDRSSAGATHVQVSNAGQPSSSSQHAQDVALPHGDPHFHSTLPSLFQNAGDAAAQLRQYRAVNGSRNSLGSMSVSSLGSKNRNSFYPTQNKVSKLHSIIRTEQHNLLSREFECDLAKTLVDGFYRGLLTQYSHQFLGSQMSSAYLAITRKWPTALAELVVRHCQHMESELDMLTKLLHEP